MAPVGFAQILRIPVKANSFIKNYKITFHQIKWASKGEGLLYDC